MTERSAPQHAATWFDPVARVLVADDPSPEIERNIRNMPQHPCCGQRNTDTFLPLGKVIEDVAECVAQHPPLTPHGAAAVAPTTPTLDGDDPLDWATSCPGTLHRGTIMSAGADVLSDVAYPSEHAWVAHVLWIVHPYRMDAWEAARPSASERALAGLSPRTASRAIICALAAIDPLRGSAALAAAPTSP